MATASVLSSPKAPPPSHQADSYKQQQQQQQQDEKDEETQYCRACFSTALRTDWAAGDRVCTSCGVVDEGHLLDDRPEWREFDDEAPTAPVRCGMVPSNEERWIGGLQPTTLSKTVFGGPNHSSSRVRKTLVKCHYKTERQMEQRHAKTVQNAKLQQLLRRKRKLRNDDAGYPPDDDNLEEASYYVQHPRLLKDSLVVDEEETLGLATTAALYAEKWSLTRCLLLFGKPEEQASVPAAEAACVEDLRRNMDSVLTTAAREMYRSYTILVKAGRALHLSESILNDAANYLSAYAARKDSLAVRGVASMLKRNPSKKVSPEVQKQAQMALREYNAVKQYSALAAVLLFYTARRKGHFRPLADVCRAIPSDSLKPSPHLEWTKGEPLLKLRHCSKAMTEVKKVFPDLAKNSPVDADSVASNGTSATMERSGIDTASVQNYVTHATQSLHLPPVAEACLQILLPRTLGAEKLPLETATLAYFLGLAGKTMQKLAAQSNHRKRPRRTLLNSSLTVKQATQSISSTIIKTKNEKTIDTTKPDGPVSSNGGTLGTIAAEEKAYEMHRVWSAWNDQTPWLRSLAEISKATQVPIHKIQENYKQKIHPQRHSLLKQLSEASTEHIPLSSVLLPHIALAAPLMKDS